MNPVLIRLTILKSRLQTLKHQGRAVSYQSFPDAVTLAALENDLDLLISGKGTRAALEEKVQSIKKIETLHPDMVRWLTLASNLDA